MHPQNDFCNTGVRSGLVVYGGCEISEEDDCECWFIFSASAELMYSLVKSLTFGGKMSWTVFKTQFDVLKSMNGRTGPVKASQLAASLRGSATEVLQGIPAEKLTDLTTIEKATESRF
ncbi:hypothetical protein AVEN_10355-1 [Araneus ventricosus]|uniref:Uncharacterized protein n=1 Tax=Araneus ventricosus TaxID=182803 RepID=A0A4Y2T783_ARAVE|nr:hypothetical protein AVEN_15261-1 [Araneus ventricosus]GBN73130.1 hypothetical protein AVEN_24429-1 [Araneus ventricosus]GBN95609.1 hypothetical protein AVEN_183120-1 [Araneus ventricosus]GBN95653.1 hypothetical protein AVEN_10355-1 [Araneus ventricosus]